MTIDIMKTIQRRNFMPIIKQKERGSVIVISGPSGSGKGTIIEQVLKKNSNCWLSVSTTSRPIRTNDIPGVTYNFVTQEEFETKIKENYFLEYNNYAGNYYGTPKEFIDKKIEAGIDVILEIEINGAQNIKRLIPEAVFIFIMPPSIEELEQRLRKRGTDSEEKILERFKVAYQEMNEVTKYNYVVVNDKLEEAVEKVNSILLAEKCRVDRIEEVFLNNKEETIHEGLLDNKQFDNSK